MINVGWLVLVLWLFLFVGSNVFISILSPVLDTKLELNILQGLDFLFCIFVVIVYVLRTPKVFIRPGLPFMLLSLFVVLLGYFFWGVGQNGFVDASLYLRMFLYPFLLLVMGLSIGRSVVFWRVIQAFSVVGVFVGVFVVFEFLFPRVLYTLLNADDFYRVKLDDPYVTIDYLVESRYRRLFNFHYFDDVFVFKAAGPTFNYPSTSYLLVFGFFCSFFIRRIWSALISLLAIIILSTKAGALCLLFGVVALILNKFPSQIRLQLIYCFSAAVALLSVILMMQSKNVHIYSLMSSLVNLKSNLFGAGLGFGGAMTVERVITWDYDMLVGDSGVAIALNMMGVVGVSLYFFYGRVLHLALQDSRDNSDVRMFVILVLGLAAMVNSILQELALGPYAIGLVMFFIGVSLANKNKLNFR